MRKLVAYVLTLALVLGLANGTFVAKAASYTDVTLTGTDVRDTEVNEDGEQWAIFFTTSGFTSTDWSRKYEGFTYEVNGKTGVTGQASAADVNRLYCTIPTSELPNVDGTVVTIKAGQYDPDGGTATEGLNIKNDITLVVAEGSLVQAQVIDAAQVETFNHSANSFYFSLKDANGNAISTGLETWDNFLSPAQPNGLRVEQPDWDSVYSGVFVDGEVVIYGGWPGGSLEFKNYEPGNFCLVGLNAKNGTTVVIKGLFASSTQSKWDEMGKFFIQELTFSYDGSQWHVVKDIVDTEYKGTPVFSHTGSGANGFYFKAGETAFPYDEAGWSYKSIANDDPESGVFLNGTKTEVYLKKVGKDAWYVCIGDKGIVPVANDIITIKGIFTYESHSITFKEAKFIFDGTEYKAYKEPEPEVVVQYTEGKITGFDKSAEPTHNGKAWVCYLSVSSQLLGGAWDDGGTYPIRANINGGSEFSPIVKKAGNKTLYVEISSIGFLNEDDLTITLKAGTYVKSKEAYGLVLEEDFVFYITKRGWSTSDAMLSSNITKRNWTLTESHSEVGFYVESNAADSLPIGGWDIEYVLEENVTFQKLEDCKSFVNVSRLGVKAGVAATYVIGGLVYDETTQRYVQYESIKIHWDGTTWTQLGYSLDDSKVDADIDGDAKLGIRDLIRYKRHWENTFLAINEARADVNYDGNVDAYDVVSLQKVLSGEFVYRSESERTDIPYGIPFTPISFEKNQTLQLAAGSTNSNTGDSRLTSVSASGSAVSIDCMDSKDGVQAYEVKAEASASVTFTFAYATDVLVNLDGKVSKASIADGIYTCNVGAGESVVIVPIRAATMEEFVDFIVEVDDEPVVLQISDTQIIDSAQDVDGVLGGVQLEYSAPERMEENCFDYLDELIENTNPDFIIMTGDNVYGRFDDNGTSFRRLIDYMESKQIPWAPVWGNHDSETEVTEGALGGIDVYCKWLEEAEYCMFKQRTLTGNGNYTVGIKQGDEVTRVFFMLDSNGIGSPSDVTMANGHTSTDFGFAQDQVAWYTKTAETISSISDVKYSFAFHIPIAAFTDAYAQYGYTNSGRKNLPINIDTHEERKEGDFGYLGSGAYEWDTSRIVYDGFKKMGVDSIFVGHEHTNSASVVYEGIRFQYGQKSSTYDALNFIDLSTGNVKSAECNTTLTPLVGGTVLPLDEDGSIVNPHIYMVGFENGIVDWESFK